jgi:ribosome-binding factor A
MQGDRKLRVGHAIQQEISRMVKKDLKDPSIGFTTITHVKMSADLRYAKIYVSIMGSEEEKKKTLNGLARARGFIRKELAGRLNLRYTPELSFFIDDTIEKAAHLEKLFHKLEKEESLKADTEDNERGEE